MASNASARLTEISTAMDTCPQNMLTLEAHEHLDSIRMNLSGVDAILGDINNIIQSYLTYKTQQLTEKPLPPVPPQGIDPNVLPIPENLNDLHEKLAQFKQAMGNVGASGEVSD